MGVIFAASLFLGLGQDANLVVFYDARSVFHKQRAANFYRTTANTKMVRVRKNSKRRKASVLACSLIQIPLALVESLIFGSLVYWLGGLVSEVGAFLLFEFFLTLTILVFAAMYFLLAAVSPNLNIAKPIGMVCVLLFVLFAGFIVAKNSIPGWLSWLYWLDPVAWTVRSIAVSQYRSSKLDVCVYQGVDYCSTYGQTMGEYSLGLFDVPSDKTWVVYGVIYLVATYVAVMTISYFVLEFHRYERPDNVALPHDPVDEVPAEVAYNLVSSPQASGPVNALSSSDNDVVVGVKTASHPVKTPPVTVAFRDLWYTVSVPGGRGQPEKNVDLLKGVAGYALPGTMTALTGSTGAGKTTLIDVIAGRKTAGTIKGDILLNGFPATDLSIRRCTGYCEQTDVHSTALTFREALTFSAFLRQDATVPDSVKYDTVDECLELLGLDDVADHVVCGSSMDKMKRLTIGVEMAAQPSVLFLNEPTSGLDARSAKLIMDGVRRVADSGRTVVSTILQPSTDVFLLFDSLLLLKRGGETVYFGELGRGGSSIVRYFEAIPSVPRIKEGYNPATWMLEVIGAGVACHRKAEASAATTPNRPSKESIREDFVAVFNASSTKALLDAKLAGSGLFQPSTESKPLSYAGKRAASNVVQLQFLLLTTYWRTPSCSLTRLGISLLLGLIFGFVYLGAEYETYQGINSGLGMVYLSTMFIALVSFMSGLPLACEERSAFYRERAAQTYNSAWFFLSFSLVEIPYVLAGALLFTVAYYPMVGLGGFPDAVFYWFNLALLILFEAYLAQLAMFSASTMELATIFGVLINAFGLMLTGFNPPALQIPAGYKWIYDVCPHRYSFSVLVATVFGDCSDAQLADISLSSANASSLDLSNYPLGCRIVQNAPASVGEIPVKLYVDQVFGVKHEQIGEYVGFFIVILLAFRALTALVMRFVNHQQR
ncbi:ABC transporter G family member 36 [Phytophthora rubi]|uniref:ABC transporter G family member 36 n=2 Tax=Phytophthora TaxID=4783 RepID=A0A6A3MH70_9STRA|nr:ABC transporter G family member 36 [Phytophthora rubi]